MPVKAATPNPLVPERHHPYSMRFALLQLSERSVAEDAGPDDP